MLSVGATDGSILLWKVVFQESGGDDLDTGNDEELAVENGTNHHGMRISFVRI